MRKAPFVSLAITLLLIPSVHPIHAATSSQADLDREYSQVRKIALKDPRVQEAFAKANDRLDQKIIEIDPSLKPIVERHAKAAQAPTPVAVQTKIPKTESHPSASVPPGGREHVVAKGDTLSSIAAHYKVKVAGLEKINHITDDRKLQVGQKLVIPASESIETQPASESEQETPPKESGGLWDRVKSSL